MTKDKQLEDLDPMPFGKYKDTPMQDVPASYLYWLWTKEGFEHQKSVVANYIRKSLPSLKEEYSDGIW